MIRPCFLVVDKEFASSISTRKLVIETAKFNVITAYSGAEAIETLGIFPAVNGIVLDAEMRDISAPALCRKLKGMEPTVPIVLVGSPGQPPVPEADHYVDSFDPVRILELLRALEPRRTAEIEKRNALLEVEGLEKAATP